MLNWFYWQKNCETIHNQVAELASCEPLHGNPIYWTTDARLYKIAPLLLRLLSLHFATHPPTLFPNSVIQGFISNTAALSQIHPNRGLFVFFKQNSNKTFVDRISRTEPQMLAFITGSGLLNSFFFFNRHVTESTSIMHA